MQDRNYLHFRLSGPESDGAMTENFWTHLGIVAVPALMILGFWFDSRRERHRERQENTDRHSENRDQLARIETKIEPIWKWWNNGSNGKEV